MSGSTMRATILLLAACALLPAPAPAALPPGQEVDQKEVCLTCHDLEEALAAKVKHAPMETGECSACHNPHVSRFDALLRERPASLCVECHAEIETAMQRSVVHQPVADGRCVDCHTPHGGDEIGLLTMPAGQLCRDCHGVVASWDERPVKHPPFAQGDCAACHDPHAADHPGLASGPGGAACASCHEVTAEFKQRHRGYPVETASCQQCHDPHASKREGLFRTHLHAPFEEGDCTTCHAGAGSAAPFALVEAEAGLCAACHEDQVEQSRDAPFPHVSAGGGNCSDCHNPHSGDDSNLLKADLHSLCLDCHDPGGAKSGQAGRFASHAGELPCVSCHVPHGGDDPLMLVDGPVETCARCHTHEHGIRHPLGEDTRDPRSGNPMTCLSCHGMHDAPYEMYLHASDERELCLGCHKDIGGGR